MVIRTGGGAYSEVKPTFQEEMEVMDEEMDDILDGIEKEDDEYIQYLIG